MPSSRFHPERLGALPKSIAFISGKPLPSASIVGLTMTLARQAKKTSKPRTYRKLAPMKFVPGSHHFQSFSFIFL